MNFVPGRRSAATSTLVVLLALLLSACGTTSPRQGGSSSGGGYYQDDGPPPKGEGPKPSSVPNPSPRVEPKSRYGNKPYTALGKRYYPIDSAEGFRESGYASWYGRKYHGNHTSNGEVYDMFAMTAAHPTLPLPTYVRVTNRSNGKSVVVRVNDRGPFLNNRVIDLSYMAARKLDIVDTGTGLVDIVAITSDNAPLPGQSPVRVASTPSTTSSISSTLVPSAQAASGYAVYVQAGSFALRDNAELLRSRLASAGIASVSLSPSHDGQRTMYRVRVGPVADVEGEILNQSRAVESITGSRAYVVREPCTQNGC